MKHLFFVHSHITYLIARQVVVHERLASADCLFLLLRGFAAPADCPVPVAALDAVTVPLSPKFWAVWGRIAALDRRIAALTGGSPFTLYAPHTDNPTVRLLYTNRQCQAVHYLEEGSASYIPRERWRRPFSFTNKVVRYLYSRGRYPDLIQFEDFYGKAYCMSDYCFPGMPRKVVLPLPFRKVQIDPDPSGQAVLVLDALLEFGLVEPVAFRLALHQLLDWLVTQGRREVLFKYHPVQGRDPERRAYYERELFAPFADRLRFGELGGEVSLEDLAYSYPNVQFAIITSSVGLYAAFCGQRVVSVAQVLAAGSPTFAARLALMPPVFNEVTEFLPVATKV